MRRFRVLELIKTLDTGGAEVLLTERLRMAPRHQCDYLVACLRTSDGRLVGRLRDAGIRVVDLTSAPSILAYLRLLALVWRHAPDVINAHSPLPAGLLRPLIRLMPRRPVFVSTVHSVAYRPATMLVDGITRGWEDRTIAVSPQVAAAPTVRGAKRLVTRVHGVDVAQQRRWADRAASIRAQFDVPVNAFLVVCVANLRPVKNHLLLIRAAEAVIAAQPHALFLLAGDGPMRARIAAEIERRNLAGRVRMLGHVAGAGRLVAAADLVVLSSTYEGLPVVVMEALAAGVPVVATAVGGLRDLVTEGHNGILTEPGSAVALADGIVAAMEPVLHQRLRRAAAGAERLDMAKTATWFEDLYLELVADRRA
ncbi:MAG TPA: glycosyltransferase [Micromonosporaceae bacterium]|nr:glycosyltransferase [Micromonosporaceae bacterium]